MTRQRIAIDMDEVLADTLGAVVKAVNERADLNIKMESLNGKKLKHMIPEHEGLVMDILKEPGFFRNLDVMPHAQEVVKQLNEHYDIYIATAAMDVPTSFHDKYEWLLEYFPFLDPQHFVFCGRKNIILADYLIDDNPKQLEIFEGKSIMFTASHNVNEHRFERVMIVCDPGMVNIGYTDIVEQVLRRRENQPQIKVFNEVEPNPSTHTVYKGLEMFINFQPNTIIALGGGSAMDAAKAIWMFFEHPETSFFGAKQKFLDIRKRTYKITKPKNAKFICIPTTSGTGSEVTPFAVITDSETHVKYPLADYALTPDIAIVDPQFVLSVPKDVAADTGMDVLTHAIESYVSVMASDYTRGLSLQAIKLTFDYLKSSVQENDKHSREKMHNASTMAGMAFANAFLGISHSIAHKIGGEYGIPHGRTNAILLPHVIRYNAKDPQKHALFPKYDFFRADTDYADIAKFLGLKGNTTEELVDALANAVYDLGCSVGIDMNLKSQGVTEELLHSTIDRMAELAFEDQCTTANPKEPLISELKGIIETAYDYER